MAKRKRTATKTHGSSAARWVEMTNPDTSRRARRRLQAFARSAEGKKAIANARRAGKSESMAEAIEDRAKEETMNKLISEMTSEEIDHEVYTLIRISPRSLAALKGALLSPPERAHPSLWRKIDRSLQRLLKQGKIRNMGQANGNLWDVNPGGAA